MVDKSLIKQILNPHTYSHLSFKKGVAHRLIIYILLFSSLITFIMVAIQLFFDYNRDLNLIKSRVEQIENSYLQGIVASLWMSDTKLLKIQMEGIHKLPDIQYLSIREDNEVIIEVGEKQEQQTIQYTIPLIYTRYDEKINLGTFQISVSLKGVYHRLGNRVVVILITQAIKTFIVSAFIFLIVYLVITRHLQDMAQYTRTMSFQDPGTTLMLDRKPENFNSDELDQLVHSINKMRQNLNRTYSELRENNERLLTEIKEREKVKNDLEKAKENAEIANRAKSEFLANVSHEVRTPINAITGFSELLKPLLSDQKQLRYLMSIQAAGGKLLQMINDILELAKVDSDMMEIRNTPIQTQLIFDEIEQQSQEEAKGKSLEFILHVDKNLPHSLLMDEIKLRQILRNIIENSLKFTEKGQIHLTVSAKNRNREQKTVDLFLSIEDTGVGIPHKNRHQIFDPFHQWDGKTTRKHGGIGLGLALCKRMVTMMNGVLYVKSEVGLGSCFEIVFRNVKVYSYEPPKEEIVAMQDIFFEKAKVLIVDDVKINRDILSVELEDVNLEVLTSSDGEEALLIAEEYQPDVIVMDIRMPIMNGYEATKLLKGDPKTSHIPVIALTASITTSEHSKLMETGFEATLGKPISIPQLFGILSQYLKHYYIKDEQQMEMDLPKELLPKLPELIEKLERQIIPQWVKLQKKQSMNELKSFAEEINQLASHYHLPVLNRLSQRLISYVDHFDIEKIRKILKTIPSIVQQLRAWKDPEQESKNDTD